MKKPKRILVGLKTPEQAIELTDYACRTGAHNASLLLVHVIELPDVTPLTADVPALEATGNNLLKAAARVAKRSGMRVRTMLLRAHSAGDALLDVLKEEKVELAVLGYHHKKTIGEMLLGTTAQHLMKHAPCHVLVSVPPQKA